MTFHMITKSKLTDFNNTLNPSQLHDLVVSQTSITTPFAGVFVNGDTVSFAFTDPLSSPELDALNALIASYHYVAPRPDNEVVVAETTNERRTEGFFSVKSYKISALPNQITSTDIVFPYGIEAQGIHLITMGQPDNDTISVRMFPKLPGAAPFQNTFGVLAANVDAGDTVIPVASPALYGFRTGFRLLIGNNDLSSDVGMSSNVDYTNGTITLENPLTTGYTAGTPVQVGVTMMDRKHVPPFNTSNAYGSFNILSSYIGKESIVRVCYNNTSLTETRTFIADLEYRYADP